MERSDRLATGAPRTTPDRQGPTYLKVIVDSSFVVIVSWLLAIA